MKKFETGGTYKAKSICDSSHTWEFTVTKRTAKQITVSSTEGTKTVGVKEHEGREVAYPLGNYSMAPMNRA